MLSRRTIANLSRECGFFDFFRFLCALAPLREVLFDNHAEVSTELEICRLFFVLVMQAVSEDPIIAADVPQCHP